MRGAAHAGAGAPERHPVDVFPADPPPLGLFLQARSRDGYLAPPEAPILGADTHGRERPTAIIRVDVNDRKSVGFGKNVSKRVEMGGRGCINKKKHVILTKKNK